MDKEISTVAQKIGLPPGSLVYVGGGKNAKVTINLSTPLNDNF